MLPSRIFLTTVLFGWILVRLHPELAVAQTTLPGQERGGQGGTPAAEELLHRAILTIEQHHAISAKTRQRIELLGKELNGTGSYLEQRSAEGIQLRLETRFSLGDRPCTLLQVCNGRYLWVYEQLNEKPSLSRVDMARVAQVVEEKGIGADAANFATWPGLGGLPKLLRGLRATFDFTSIQEGVLPGSFPVVCLSGQWKRERLATMLPAQQEAIRAGRPVDLARLPPHVPHSVAIFLGRQDLFPYRIEYRRREGIADALRSGTAGTERELAAMDLFEVSLNVPIPASRFIYDPTIEYSDRTDRFLSSLGLKK